MDIKDNNTFPDWLTPKDELDAQKENNETAFDAAPVPSAMPQDMTMQTNENVMKIVGRTLDGTRSVRETLYPQEDHQTLAA